MTPAGPVGRKEASSSVCTLGGSLCSRARLVLGTHLSQGRLVLPEFVSVGGLLPMQVIKI